MRRLHSAMALNGFVLLGLMAPPAWAAAGAAPPPRDRAEVEAVLDRAPAAPPEGMLRPLNIVLVADEKDHGVGEHDYPLWQKRWKVLLGGQQDGDQPQVNLHGPAPAKLPKDALAGAPKVKVTTAWQWPSPEQFKSADLLVFFCYRSGGERRTWGANRVKTLDDYVTRGGGLVVIHSATYTLADLSKPEGKAIIGLTGLVFDKSIQVRHGPMTLRIPDAKNPICLGLPSKIEIVDEPYWPPMGDPRSVDVLVTSEEAVAKGATKTRPEPMFWTYAHGKGHVFGCTPGHFNWTFDDAYFRLLLLRGMAWAAGQSPYRFDCLTLR